MFLVLWEFEVKPGASNVFKKSMGLAVTGIPFFAAIRTMQNPTVFKTRRGAVCTSLLTTGFPEKLTRHSLNFGEANTKTLDAVTKI